MDKGKMNTDQLTEALPPGFTARFWSGVKWNTEDRIYINYGKRGKAGNYILFTDGGYQRNRFDHGLGEIEAIHQAFKEWWESKTKTDILNGGKDGRDKD